MKTRKPNKNRMPKFDLRRYAEAPALRLSNGHVAKLPIPFDLVEVTLVGNHWEFPGGIVAMYDSTTKTGFVYTRPTRRWSMLQPIEREEFARALAMGSQAEGGGEDGNSIH